MATSVELRQRRASLWEEAKSLHNLAEKEHRSMSAEEMEQWDRINGEIDSLKGTIDRMERIAAVDDEMAEVQQPAARSNFTKFEQHGQSMEFGDSGGDEDGPLPKSDEYRKAFGGYLRQGLGGMKPELRAVIQPFYGAMNVRALSTSAAASGGALVPEEFYRTMIEAMKAYGGMRQAKTTKLSTASGANMPIPMADDTDNEGEILSEGSAVSTTGTDPVFGSKDLGAFLYTSKMVRASMQLINDSAFPFETWLAQALGRRLGRVTNRHFTVGTGDGQPEGILTMAAAGVTDGDLTDYLDLIALEHSVDPAYRLNAEWMFHDTTLALLKQIKGDNGAPLWLPGVAVGAPDTILRYPYIINQNMPEGDAGNKAMLFGDFSYYFIRDVQDIRVLRLEERFAEYLQIGFLAFLRTDGVFATPSAVTDSEFGPQHQCTGEVSGAGRGERLSESLFDCQGRVTRPGPGRPCNE